MEFLLKSFTAIWLGILTSISPCPLATNIAAISFIGKKVGSGWHTLLSGLSYMFGRMLAYMLISIMLLAGLTSVPSIALFLQKNMNKFLGPILIIVGLFLLGVFKMSFSGNLAGDGVKKFAETHHMSGAALLGILFALSFCPVSAALFFGSLIPLSIKYDSNFIFPSLYGIGTALPVVAFAVILAFSAKTVGKVFNRITQVEYWSRMTTGVLFELIGIYFTLKYVFALNINF